MIKVLNRNLKSIILVVTTVGVMTSCSLLSIDDNNDSIDLDSDFISGVLDLAEIKQRSILTKNRDDGLFPEFIDDGQIFYVRSKDWTSGFYPGIHWILYSATENEEWKKSAEKWTVSLSGSRSLTSTHDLGFMIIPSLYRGYLNTGSETYRLYVIEAAESLLTRYNAHIRLIKSWDGTRWSYPVIIDSMVNMELLYIASELTNDPKYLTAAINHIESIIGSHIRTDGSVRHVVDFDPNTGEVLEVAGGQGMSAVSTWSRGQAWSILGFALAYKYTLDERYLNRFEKALNFYMDNLPNDGMPQWDFTVEGVNKSNKDSSAGFITINALLQMALTTPVPEKEKIYKDLAFSLIKKAYYNGYISSDINYPGLSIHSIGHKPRSRQINVTLLYADYYLLKSIFAIKEHFLEEFNEFNSR